MRHALPLVSNDGAGADPALSQLGLRTAERRPDAMRRPLVWGHLQSQGVAKYALPESLHLMTKLPISTVGKLNKRMLRDLLSQEQVQLLKPDESHTRGS